MSNRHLRSTPTDDDHSAKPKSLCTKGFFAAAHTAGLRNDTQIAEALGMTRSAVWKVRNGVHEPGPRFIARALQIFPDVDLRELFAPRPPEGAS